MITKRIHSQDAYYKISPKNSGETSLNLSNEILQFIAPEVSKGDEIAISFTVFRADYLKALGVIFNHSPLYISSSKSSTEVKSDPNVFLGDFESICSFFGPNETNIYTVNLIYRKDGRIYLNSLEDKSSKFNLRHFLLEEMSSLVFDKNENGIIIRLISDSIIDDLPFHNLKSELIVSEKKLTSFVFSVIRHFDERDKLDAIVPFMSTSSPIKVSKENSFSLTGMFLESTIEDVKERNKDHARWFEEIFTPGDRNVYLSTQWNSQGNYQLTLDDFIKMIQTCYGNNYFYKTGPKGEHQLFFANTSKTDVIRVPASNIITPYLTALRTKPFMLLAGISGTGKSRIVRELSKACWQEGDEEYGKNHPRNFCMVQVKPNWHDSSELIGYVSRINGEKYVVGPFLRFLAKAIKDENTPYFLCLDEMNLAPVEQYFAEYLSVIESRKLNADGSITTDPIIPFEDTEAYGTLIDQLFDTEADRIAYKSKDGKRLTIPQNLFVIGTVNMDETTFSFSRKVLDRAMTIEMNEVNLYGGLTDEGSEIGYIGNCIIGDTAEGKDVYADNKELCDQVLAYLEKVNAVLEGTPFKIAYRTRNEFLLYAVNRQLLDKDSQLWQTLDEMTSMKILSRIEGDSERTKTVLEGLKALVDSEIVANIPETEDEGKTKSITVAKIEEMLGKLISGYTSYWA